MSLVESCCAVAILAVAIAGLTNLAATTAALHQFGKEKGAAVRAVQREIATIAASDFAGLVANFDGAGFAAGLEEAGGTGLRPLEGDDDGMPGRVRVTAPTGNAAQLVEIEVRVDWICRHGPAAVVRRVRLSSLGTGA